MWWLLLACPSEPAPVTTPVNRVERAVPLVAADPDLARPEPAWIEERVADAHARLLQSDGGQMIREVIEGSGGLAAWYAASPLSFRFDYRPRNGKPVRDTRQVVDTWRARAVHTWSEDDRVTFGWDGTTAWKAGPSAKMKINPRFWALTPYYFVGMPFVLADEGVRLSVVGEAEFEGKTYSLVRAVFEAGTGDAPDDAYIVYVDEEARRIAALRYIVSYPGFFDEGEHSPWKIMAYDGTQEVAGLKLPERFRTFAWLGEDEEGEPGALVTEITLSDVEVKPDLRFDAFVMPEAATPQAEF